MTRDGYALFSEGHIGTMALKNRLVRSATGGDLKPIRDGKLDTLLVLYRNLAAGGVGLIISGVTPGFSTEMLDDKSAGRRAIEESYFEAFGRIADEVRSVAPACKMIVQLGGPGREQGIGPSDVPTPFQRGRVRPLSVVEIHSIVDAYVETIARLQESGLGGVQIQAAHGHALLHAFLSPYTNHRRDAYGGSVANRVRIIREIVGRARDRVGDFPILIKVNCTDNLQGGTDLDAFPELAQEIERTGVDAIEVSGGTMDCLVRSEAELGFRPVPVPYAHTRIARPEKQSYYLRYVQKLTLEIPLILVGGHRDVERLERVVQRGEADFIALCRPLISEPDLPSRWLEARGSPTTDCISCNSCLGPLMRGSVPYCVFKQDQARYKVIQEGLAQWVQGHVAL
jgi:2,4-dienoyl-CoA reductase-like NADH-dependent reductase (Old Yellow Enzyme family)